MKHTKKLLGFVDTEARHEANLDIEAVYEADYCIAQERYFLGIPHKDNDSILLSQAQRKIKVDFADIDRECLQAYVRVLNPRNLNLVGLHNGEIVEQSKVHNDVWVDKDKTAVKGADIGLAALRMVQGKQQPSMVDFYGFTVPRPFIFYRDLAVVRGFWYVFENFAPKAKDITVPQESPKSLDELFSLDNVRTIAENSHKHTRILAVPTAKGYASNTGDESIMFIYDPGNLSKEAINFIRRVIRDSIKREAVADTTSIHLT